MAEKERIFHRFRHQRPGKLLEAGSEQRGRIAAAGVQVAGEDPHQQA